MRKTIWHSLLARALRRLGYRLIRLRPLNRFDAMFESLTLLRDRGFAPRVVIDGGANMGNWSRETLRIFPEAQFHLIEPQPACWPALEQLAEDAPRVTVHPLALTEAGVKSVCMVGVGPAGGSTGAHVMLPFESSSGESTLSLPATTLDELLADTVQPADRALLKLDLELHELTALRGAERLLNSVEVLITELQFFDVNDGGAPVFADFITFFRDREFELYDIAALAPRLRDCRLCHGDVIFVRQNSPLLDDRAWI